MNIENERKLFQEAYKSSRDYKFYIRHETSEKQIFEIARKKYKVECVNDAWLIWQASANREGFVLVPEEPTERMLDSAYSSISDNLHYADLENIYKAMIWSAQEIKDD